MDHTNNITASQTFCPAPWTSLNINQIGIVTPCLNSGFHLGNIKQKNLYEILQDEPIKSMKQAQLQGQWHPGCIECKNRESYGDSPRTLWHTEPQVKQNIQNDVDNFFVVEHLTVNWSNLCNLACTYCNAETSTAWQAIKQIPIDYVKNEHDSLIELVARSKNNLKGLSLGGGEPLLQKTLPGLLANIDPTNVSVMVTTNLSVPLESNPVYAILRDWPNVSWIISFENANKEQFEYVRHGASWEVFLKNIDIMQQQQQNVSAHPAYSVYCALDLENLYQFCYEKNLSIWWCDLYHPEVLDIRRHNIKLRQLAIEQIDLVCENYTGKVTGMYETLQRYRQQLVDPSYLRPMRLDRFALQLFSEKIEQELKKTHRFADLWPHVHELL